MKILAFADLHDYCIDKIEQVDYSAYGCDLCITLGDINLQHLQTIKRNVDIPICGVLGNHDDYDLLTKCGIVSLDGITLTVKSIHFTGLSGSSRYKVDDKPMLTQRESITLAKQLPPADILVSHDSAFGLYSARLAPAHCGLKGISRYIRKYKPIVNLHGHHHENCVKDGRYTTDICVFGCSVIEVLCKGLVYVTRVF